MVQRKVSKSTMRLAAIQMRKTISRGLSRRDSRYHIGEMKALARTCSPQELREAAEMLKTEAAKRKAAQAQRASEGK